MKKTAIFIIAIIVLLPLTAVLWPDAPGVPVLSYHKITAGQPVNNLALPVREFERQIEYLRQTGYTAVSPGQLREYLQEGRPLPVRSVLITFDDGYEDNYRQAFPVLKKFNFTAVVFLVTDAIGVQDGYLTWPQIWEMQDNGLFFGSHTATHANISELDEITARRELGRSFSHLWQRLGKPAPYFAYPGGAYTQETLSIIKSTKYRLAFSTKFGLAAPYGDPYQVERIPIVHSAFPFADFYLRLRFPRLMGWLKAVRAHL